MPSNPPGRTLSSKLLKLGCLRAKVVDETPRPEEKDFQITHTPDRLIPNRPTPTEEECREEIKRWHAAADKERFGFEEVLVRNAAESGTRQRPTRKEANRSLKKRYEFRESDEEDSDQGKGNKGKGKEVMSDRSNTTGQNNAGIINKDPGFFDTKENRRIIDPVLFDMEEDKREKIRKNPVVVNQQPRLIREMGGPDTPPIFQPPEPHRDVEDQRWMTGKYQASREALRPVVRWTPPRAAFAKPVLRRSASTADLELMNDASEDEAVGSEDGQEVDLDWLIKTELYKRGVCPECRSMRSKIEAFRCANCGSDLAGCWTGGISAYGDIFFQDVTASHVEVYIYFFFLSSGGVSGTWSGFRFGANFKTPNTYTDRGISSSNATAPSSKVFVETPSG
ncbi:hypothetical protein OQA88_4678 [Cercophora sp. LCS_1]